MTSDQIITDSEARAMALQGIVEIARGVDFAIDEIRAGRFMQAQETLLLAKAGTVVAEAAIQRIRTPAALIAEAVEEARGEDAKAVRALAYELIQPGRGLGTTFVSGVRAGAFEAGQQFKALGARIARGEVSP